MDKDERLQRAKFVVGVWCRKHGYVVPTSRTTLRTWAKRIQKDGTPFKMDAKAE